MEPCRPKFNHNLTRGSRTRKARTAHTVVRTTLGGKKCLNRGNITTGEVTYIYERGVASRSGEEVFQQS